MTTGRWRSFGAILALWTAFGLYSAAETHYRSSFGKMPHSWARSIAGETAYTLLWAVLTPAVMWLARRFRIEKSERWRNLGLHAAVSIVCSLLAKTAWDLVFETQVPGTLVGSSWTRYFLSMSAGFTEGICCYWLILTATCAYDYYRQYQAGLVRASSLQTQLVQAQLQALKMQLHPHFLFNALHSISALIPQDPEGADRMIARLSEMLRLSLQSGGAQQIPLHQELRFLNLYLEIEKTRFEERLEVCFAIGPGTQDALVPNMVFQPLVENAIRHGLAPRVSGGRILIEAERDGRQLLLRVKDNGEGLSGDGALAGQGIGLSATRGRLERLYGSDQSLLLRNVHGGGVEALITIPYLTSSEDADDANQDSDRG